ncbi:MAG: hypothetical protein CME06_06060 [Gemmatimonadetes bacterium]|nr:hypothetical protein [Gemmatimonadota bacterium]
MIPDPIGWRLRRLAVMTPVEIGSRSFRWLRDRLRSALWAAGVLPSDYDPGDPRNRRVIKGGGRHVVWDRGSFLLANPLPEIRTVDQERFDPCVDAAEATLRGGWCPLFGLASIPIREADDWHRDPLGAGKWPREFAPLINHRDSTRGGARFVWELHRLPQLALLGRAYCATGDRRFALGVAEVLRSWLDANPPETGIAWQSPLELAIRMIAMLHAADLIAGSGAISEELGRELGVCAAHHGAAIARSLSRGSSANNHTIGEAAGLIVLGACLPSLRSAENWIDRGTRTLRRELSRQFARDGSGREQAPHYQAFATGFVLQALLALRRAGRPAPAFLEEHLRRSARFLVELVVEGNYAIEPGDSDDGVVHGLGGSPDRSLAETAQAAAFASGSTEVLPPALRAQIFPSTRWFLNPIRFPPGFKGSCGESSISPDAGWIVFRGGTPRKTLFFDAGPHGLAPLDAHAHADALSFALYVDGDEVVVDPGTYRYHSGGVWRDRFRSTAAHATIEIDGVDQSRIAGPFLWRSRARARITECHLGGDLELVSAEHDGYQGLRDPVWHRRSVLHLGPGRFLIYDTIDCEREHDLRLAFPLPAGAKEAHQHDAIPEEGLAVFIATSTGAGIDMLLGASFPARVEVDEGSISRRFGEREAAPLLRVTGRIEGSARLFTYFAGAAAEEEVGDLAHHGSWMPVLRRDGTPAPHSVGLRIDDPSGTRWTALVAPGVPGRSLELGPLRFSGVAASLFEPRDGGRPTIESLAGSATQLGAVSVEEFEGARFGPPENQEVQP